LIFSGQVEYAYVVRRKKTKATKSGLQNMKTERNKVKKNKQSARLEATS
jgi:hypothetical protein